MQEFMLIIRNEGDSKSALSPAKHEEFLRQCEQYIERLKKANKFISAKPMQLEGWKISGSADAWKEESLSMFFEVIVGYYHICADSTEDAIGIAKENPEFQYNEGASVEVRPLKMKEDSTGYVYPSS
jgi:hypothetical protein